MPSRHFRSTGSVSENMEAICCDAEISGRRQMNDEADLALFGVSGAVTCARHRREN